MTTTALDQLKAVFPSQLADATLQFFLDTATELAGDVLKNSGLSSDRKDKITIFLAAHMAHSTAPRAEMEMIGSEYKYSVQGKTGMDLKATFYGQNALALDTSGSLQRLGSKIAGITTLNSGTNYRTKTEP